MENKHTNSSNNLPYIFIIILVILISWLVFLIGKNYYNIFSNKKEEIVKDTIVSGDKNLSKENNFWIEKSKNIWLLYKQLSTDNKTFDDDLLYLINLRINSEDDLKILTDNLKNKEYQKIINELLKSWKNTKEEIIDFLYMLISIEKYKNLSKSNIEIVKNNYNYFLLHKYNNYNNNFDYNQNYLIIDWKIYDSKFVSEIYFSWTVKTNNYNYDLKEIVNSNFLAFSEYDKYSKWLNKTFRIYDKKNNKIIYEWIQESSFREYSKYWYFVDWWVFDFVTWEIYKYKENNKYTQKDDWFYKSFLFNKDYISAISDSYSIYYWDYCKTYLENKEIWLNCEKWIYKCEIKDYEILNIIKTNPISLYFDLIFSKKDFSIIESDNYKKGKNVEDFIEIIKESKWKIEKIEDLWKNKYKALLNINWIIYEGIFEIVDNYKVNFISVNFKINNFFKNSDYNKLTNECISSWKNSFKEINSLINLFKKIENWEIMKEKLYEKIGNYSIIWWMRGNYVIIDWKIYKTNFVSEIKFSNKDEIYNYIEYDFEKIKNSNFLAFSSYPDYQNFWDEHIFRIYDKKKNQIIYEWKSTVPNHVASMWSICCEDLNYIKTSKYWYFIDLWVFDFVTWEIYKYKENNKYRQKDDWFYNGLLNTKIIISEMWWMWWNPSNVYYWDYCKEYMENKQIWLNCEKWIFKYKDYYDEIWEIVKINPVSLYFDLINWEYLDDYVECFDKYKSSSETVPRKVWIVCAYYQKYEPDQTLEDFIKIYTGSKLKIEKIEYLWENKYKSLVIINWVKYESIFEVVEGYKLKTISVNIIK